jgi:hypothetical protein
LVLLIVVGYWEFFALFAQLEVTADLEIELRWTPA